MKYNLETLKQDLKEKLSKYRYEHSLRVADICLELANIYNVNKDKAYLAGLVHDIAKEFTEQENKYYITKYKLSSIQKEYPKIIHSYIGALYLKEKYNMDIEICNAIKFHTITDTNMNTLDKIVFIADKIEPGKNYDEIEKIRDMSRKNLDQAIVLYLENNFNHLISLQKNIHPKSLETLNFLKKSN